MANLAKSGSMWEIGLLLAAIILTKLFLRDISPSLYPLEVTPTNQTILKMGQDHGVI